MYKFLKLPNETKRNAYLVTGQQTHNLLPSLVEKDFWVVLMLKILFEESHYKQYFSFKGGTSLSKAYGLIYRFSEDIDLILDWRVLGYGIHEPWEKSSNTQRDRFRKEANKRASDWISDKLLPNLQECINRLDLPEVKLSISDNDSQTIIVEYPHQFETSSALREIRLEIGPLAAWTPVVNQSISSYVAERFPQLFENISIEVPTVEAKRTLWEKINILNKVAMRQDHSVPNRFLRHYYDVYMLAHSFVKKEAFSNLQLFKHVIDFDKQFYPGNKELRELEITPETIHLIPSEEQIVQLKQDYDLMMGFFFEKPVSFELLLEYLAELEEEIHRL